MPFYKLLRKNDGFEWDEQAKQAFQDLKHYFQQMPILAPPRPGEELLLYVAKTLTIASTVLVV